jgi:hypothetical protein
MLEYAKDLVNNYTNTKLMWEQLNVIPTARYEKNMLFKNSMSKVDGNENDGGPFNVKWRWGPSWPLRIPLYSSIYIEEFKATLVFPPHLIIKVDKTLM